MGYICTLLVYYTETYIRTYYTRTVTGVHRRVDIQFGIIGVPVCIYTVPSMCVGEVPISILVHAGAINQFLF